MANLRVFLERVAELCLRRRRRGALERAAQDQLAPLDGKLRRARPADIAALRASHRRQCTALGCGYAFPDFEGDPSYRVLMLGPEAALVVKTTYEAFVIADAPPPFFALLAERQAIAAKLREHGIDELHAWTPPGMETRMGRLMRALGFRVCSPGWKAWYREV